MKIDKPLRIKTISECHKLYGIPEPEHPLISVINLNNTEYSEVNKLMMLDFYSISMKHGLTTKFKYGQKDYDFDEGTMFFIAPNQVHGKREISEEKNQNISGWVLLIHPDFFWNTSLAKKIKSYDFFNYSVNEALFLSQKEEKTLRGIVENIQQEYNSNIDKFTKQIIISHIESLFSYTERFYNRQFITREKANHKTLELLEILLTDYFNSNDLVEKGLPTVQFIADKLNVSSSYLGSLLRALTGQNTQQHIHNKLIEKAKEKLSTTDLSISEIAYELGFEHSQAFSRLFKSKTNQSPLAFRQSYN